MTSQSQDFQDSQTLTDSQVSFKSELGDDNSFNSQQILLMECEKEIQTLERDIRSQKEASVNAKTAITFDQLKKIYNIGKLLGPQKETFYDRICRAADIQRASLKNRLKQNKEKFEPGSGFMTKSPMITDMNLDSQSFLTPPGLSSFMLLPGGNELIRSLTLETPVTPVPQEEELRLPPERIMDIMQLGFSFEEVKQITELFEQYRELMRPTNPTLQQVLSQFSNFISTNIPEHLKLVSNAFNLLEMGYSRREVARSLARERRQDDDSDRPPAKIPRLSPAHNDDEKSDGENGENSS